MHTSDRQRGLTTVRDSAEGRKPTKSRYFIGGSDARIIMGDDEGALLRLWREKRGEIEPQDLSGHLIVQLGRVTEELNRRWYEANTGNVVADVERRVRHPVVRWMGATLSKRPVNPPHLWASNFPQF
jgi:predicted phage-related endonuclease